MRKKEFSNFCAFVSNIKFKKLNYFYYITYQFNNILKIWLVCS